MISLNYRDQRPLYEQVKDSLRRLVVTGALSPGEALPSVRSMAVSLAINPGTVQRAYEALEAEGYLRTVAGKGSFAAPGGGGTDGRREALLRSFDETATELIWLGFTPDQLAARLTRRPAGGQERREHP